MADIQLNMEASQIGVLGMSSKIETVNPSMGP